MTHKFPHSPCWWEEDDRTDSSLPAGRWRLHAWRQPGSGLRKKWRRWVLGPIARACLLNAAACFDWRFRWCHRTNDYYCIYYGVFFSVWFCKLRVGSCQSSGWNTACCCCCCCCPCLLISSDTFSLSAAAAVAFISTQHPCTAQRRATQAHLGTFWVLMDVICYLEFPPLCFL